MRKLKTWEIVLLIIFYPIGIMYLVYWACKKYHLNIYIKKFINYIKNEVTAQVKESQDAKIKPNIETAKPVEVAKPAETVKPVEVAKPAETVKPVEVTKPVETTKKVYSESEKNYNLFEDIVNNSVLRYEYEEKLCILDNAIEKISGNGGKFLKFVQEPNNEYDNKAVSVYLNEEKIGYVYKGQIQDMINDWIKRGDTFIGYVNKIFVAENKVTYKIGFYKPLNNFEHKRFALVKTNKKIDDDFRREDNLYGSEIGDNVIIEYDDFEESCVVFNDSYEEIGELPKSAIKFIEENDHKKLIGVISDCVINDEGKEKYKIDVYLIK